MSQRSYYVFETKGPPDRSSYHLFFSSQDLNSKRKAEVLVEVAHTWADELLDGQAESGESTRDQVGAGWTCRV